MKIPLKQKYSPVIGFLSVLCFAVALIVYAGSPKVSNAFVLLLLAGTGGLCVYIVSNRGKIQGLFRRRGVQKGLGDLLVLLLGVAVLCVVYLILRYYPLRYDVTEEKRYSLSEQSVEIIAALEYDIVIKVLAQKSSADAQTVELLKAYENVSDKIRVEYISHLSHPQVFQQYNVPYQNGEGVGALVIERDQKSAQESSKAHDPQKKYFVLFPQDLYAQSFDAASQRPSRSYQGESKITSVIGNLYQGAFEKTLLAYVQGHGEADFSDSGPMGLTKIAHALSLEHYELRKLNLLTIDAIAPEIKLLILSGPRKPLQSVEIARILEYLQHGGALFFLNDPAVQGNKSAMNALTKSWNIRADDGLILEGHPDYTATLLGVNGLLNLHLPEYSNHSIVKRLRENHLTTAFIYSMGFFRDSGESAGILIEDLLQTTEHAWLEKGGRANRFDAGVEKKGPISFGLSIVQDNTQDEKTSPQTQSRIILLGDSDFVRNSFSNIGPFENNKDFFLNCVAWLTQQKKKITIRPKELKRRDLVLTESGVDTIFYVVMVFIPLFVVMLGVGVHNRRRKGA